VYRLNMMKVEGVLSKVHIEKNLYEALDKIISGGNYYNLVA
jgi:hypothetical protein